MRLKLKFKLNTIISNEWQQNITNSKKINPNFTGHIFCCYLSVQKVLQWKSYATFVSTTNPTIYSASLWNFFGDPLVCKQRTLSLVRNTVNFFHTIPAWNHDISTSPMIFRLYLLFFLFSEHRDKHASSIQFFHGYGISFDPDTWISLFLSLISKFQSTSNLQITSKNIPCK